MNRQTQALIDYYRKAQERLIGIITDKEAMGNTTVYYKSLLRNVQAEIKRILKDIPTLAKGIVESNYVIGAQSSKADTSTVFTALDTRQIALLVTNLQTELITATNVVGRRIMDNIRRIGVEAVLSGRASGQTVREVKRDIIDKLTQPNVDMPGIRYRNGHIMPLDKYAAMVARTTSIEAAIRADLQRGQEHGFDLVICTVHSPTCNICAPFAGRMYASTIDAANGKYYGLNFPYLYDTALAHGYSVIHPNCRHSFTSVSNLSYTYDELREWSRKSTRPFIDNRTQSERKEYARTQVLNRQRNYDLIKYNQIRSALPDDAPKSFGAFRSMKRANSEQYQQLLSDMRVIKKEIAQKDITTMDLVV